MNNTVSPKQVQAIIREIEETTSNTKVKVENAGSSFLGKLKNLWEDNVSFSFCKYLFSLLK